MDTKAIKWLIILLVAIGLTVASSILFPEIPDMPVFPVFALIFGCFGVGYACARLDELTGPMRFQVHIVLGRHPKISIKRG